MNALKMLVALLFLAISSNNARAFCGFYVAKTDSRIFNQSSEIILVRDGQRSVITMSNDFQGDIRDFAMVVPVPEVLKRENIRVADPQVFAKLDAYSSPRVVEYFDHNPCQRIYPMDGISLTKSATIALEDADNETESRKDKAYGVTIEAKYNVGEYDILILSAKESTGLKEWLIDNQYQIPSQAEEVLEPYIKSQMKFFVVKVNLENHQRSGFNDLRPLQIAFESDKFMLPIRLGMANANGDQDMIVYAFTRTGRVETANYRTVNLPSNMNLPEFIDNKFNDFYRDMFRHSWEREGRNVVFLEYAWDLSSSNFVKCDPCASTPPDYAMLREAGCFWVSQQTPSRRGTSNYAGNLHFTRLHVRYNRQQFPQDLQFQLTPNKQRFQGRYVLQRMVKGDLKCKEAKPYYNGVLQRRESELETLAHLTGWDPRQFDWYTEEVAMKVEPDGGGWIKNDFNNKNTFYGFGFTDNPNDDSGPGSVIVWSLALLLALCVFSLSWTAKSTRTT